MGIIEKNLEKIRELCIRYKVEVMYAFGSITSAKFTSESDIDLLVDFFSDNPIEYTDNYFELKFALENLLNRKIDLLENKELKNPFLKRNIDLTKVFVYGRAN